jgi:hypothetical protein
MDTSERQIRRIVVERMDRCSVCHRSYEVTDIEVLSRKPDVWMMMVQCPDCHARNFVAAVIGNADAEGAADTLQHYATVHESTIAFTDEGPSIEAMNAPQVDIDDILAMHDFLESFDGDFKRLFRSSE